MALRVQTQISGDVFIFRCDGRIVFGDEGAVLRAPEGIQAKRPKMKRDGKCLRSGSHHSPLRRALHAPSRDQYDLSTYAARFFLASATVRG
jgi:hypothetical protein